MARHTHDIQEIYKEIKNDFTDTAFTKQMVISKSNKCRKAIDGYFKRYLKAGLIARVEMKRGRPRKHLRPGGPGKFYKLTESGKNITPATLQKALKESRFHFSRYHRIEGEIEGLLRRWDQELDIVLDRQDPKDLKLIGRYLQRTTAGLRFLKELKEDTIEDIQEFIDADAKRRKEWEEFLGRPENIEFRKVMSKRK